MIDAPATLPEKERTRLSLLYVEDSADDVELLACELAANAFEVEIRQVLARDEMERALREGRWDAICIDYLLPGFDAMHALQLRSEVAPDVPVIVVSGAIGEAAAVALLKAGADDYIPKHNLARLAPALRRAIRDVEDRRARRRAEEERARLVVELAKALELRDDFLVLASHELRTPITALRFQLEGAVRMSGTDEAIRHRLMRADLQISRIERLIEDMLTVSSIRPPEPVRLEDVDVRTVVTDLVRSFTMEKVEGLHTRIPAKPVVARADPKQLTDALRRIVENAVKYGEGKPIEVRLERSISSVLFTVSDHGIGIAPESHDRIFERFGRAASTSNYGGLGLGLWIVRQIVQAHGGTLDVASRLGEGATFTVSVPAARQL